jgi:hypothetical protein
VRRFTERRSDLAGGRKNQLLPYPDEGGIVNPVQVSKLSKGDGEAGGDGVEGVLTLDDIARWRGSG